LGLVRNLVASATGIIGFGFLQLVLTSSIGGSPNPLSNNSWASKMMKITLFDEPSYFKTEMVI
jgi:hypothetical protein